MIRYGLLATAALLLALLCAEQSSAHPNHVSIAEAQWNAHSGKLEIALKLHPNDLERALRAKFKRRILLEKTPDVDRLVQDYLRQVFVVKGRDGRRATLAWVGKEIEVKSGWLYFEIPLRGGPDGATFSNRMFFELLNDQVNTINLRVGTRRKSLSLTHDHPARKLQLQKR